MYFAVIEVYFAETLFYYAVIEWYYAVIERSFAAVVYVAVLLFPALRAKSKRQSELSLMVAVLAVLVVLARDSVLAAVPQWSFQSQTLRPLNCTSVAAGSALSPARLQYDATSVLSGCSTCAQYIADTCVCSAGSTATCVSGCNSTQVASYDGTFCLSCAAGRVQLSDGSYVCVCSALEYVADYTADTAVATAGVCTACPRGSYPNDNLSACISCANPQTMVAVATAAPPLYTYVCQCKPGFVALADVCVASAATVATLAVYTNTVGLVTLTSLVSVAGHTQAFSSDTFQTWYLKSLTRCAVPLHSP